MNLTLPEVPVDGYRLTFYVATDDNVIEHGAVYFMNRSYESIFSDHGRGAQFVNQWLINGGLVSTRLDGWKSMESYLQNVDGQWPKRFVGKVNAWSHVAEFVRLRITRLEDDLSQLRTVAATAARHLGR